VKRGSDKKPLGKGECATGVKPRLSSGGLKRVDGVDGVSIFMNGELARLNCEG